MLFRSEEEGLGNAICKALYIESDESRLTEWKKTVERLHNPATTVRIALVGKYVELHDAYLSVAEALTHAGIHHNAAVEIEWVNSEDLTDTASLRKKLGSCHGIILPGGFGTPPRRRCRGTRAVRPRTSRPVLHPE